MWRWTVWDRRPKRSSRFLEQGGCEKYQVQQHGVDCELGRGKEDEEGGGDGEDQQDGKKVEDRNGSSQCRRAAAFADEVRDLTTTAFTQEPTADQDEPALTGFDGLQDEGDGFGAFGRGGEGVELFPVHDRMGEGRRVSSPSGRATKKIRKTSWSVTHCCGMKARMISSRAQAMRKRV